MLCSLSFRREAAPAINFSGLMRKPDTEAAHEHAHKLTWAMLFCCIVVGLIFAAEGCSSPVGFSADATHDSAGSLTDSRKLSTAFDAGDLFANEASYLCIPLQKLGIDPSQEIVSIKSSCECVRPSVIRFLQRRSQERVTFRLDFVEDTQGHADETSPSSLGVEIKLQFASRTEHSVTVQFLHTT